MFAAKYSSTPEIVQMLLEKGAEVNVRSPDGMTPLKFAKTPEIKQLLIDAGATE
jgi:ankyrin repeat protein